jgi:hypothetical protein
MTIRDRGVTAPKPMGHDAPPETALRDSGNTLRPQFTHVFISPHDYSRPILAFARSHNWMVCGQGSSVPQLPILDAFLGNCCAAIARSLY